MYHDTMASVRTANALSGQRFFTVPDHWQSRVLGYGSKPCKTVYHGRYFLVTHLSPPGVLPEGHEYTVCEIREDGTIVAVGDWRQYGTLAEARAAIRALPAD